MCCFSTDLPLRSGTEMQYLRAELRERHQSVQARTRSHTRLFAFKGGVLAAFAMDLNEVYFCTSLRGVNSFFMPFNMGMPKAADKPYSIGKGNPHNEDGINESYMCENIWTKEKIILLIERLYL